MRIHLVAPRNPESFWTMTRILSTLGKRCVFPNLALPTLAGLTPPECEVSLCDENVEGVDFDVEADVVGITGYIVHKKRMLELAEGFRSQYQLASTSGGFPIEMRGAAYTRDQVRSQVSMLLAEAEGYQQSLADLRQVRYQRFKELDAAEYEKAPKIETQKVYEKRLREEELVRKQEREVDNRATTEPRK